MISNNTYEEYLFFAKQQFKNRHDGMGMPLKEGLQSYLIANKQCIIVSDLILVEHLYISNTLELMLGYKPSTIAPGFFLTVVHPDDYERFRTAHNRLLENAQEMLTINTMEDVIISSEFRFQNSTGHYLKILFQCCLFIYSDSFNRKSVRMLGVLTELTNSSSSSKHKHYYYGTNRIHFRVPDEDLLKMDCILTSRELQVVKLITQGCTSEQIADKLFLSSKTINTHRANVLKKMKSTNLMECVKKLEQMGLV